MNKPSATPTDIASFEIVRRLGAGGMAEVFLARKRGAEGTFKVLVLKRILPTHGGSRRFRAMFIEEAHLATRLNHPNVVQVYEFQDSGDEGLLLAMEHVEGCDLGRLMSAAKSKGTPIPPWVGAWIIAEAAKGLHYAHEKRDEAGQPLEIVHRDVSPQNILLSFEGTVKIADFGIASARLFAEEQGVLKGKFGYMSPEQARGESLNRRSDLYALGVILWEIVVGRPIHGGLGGEALLDIVRSAIVEPPSAYAPDVPSELEEIVLKALSPQRNERHATGREFAAAIGKAIVKQGELIDADALEATLAQLTRGTGSEPPPVLSDGSADQARTQAAVPLARSLPGSRSGGVADSVPPPGPNAAAEPAPAAEGPREVRHVAVLMLHLHGLVELSLPRRMVDQLQRILGNLAFKRGMRWIWQGDAKAHAVSGVATNSSRAAVDAAQLALDVHETISGIKEDLPAPVAASIGIVRGIATGVTGRSRAPRSIRAPRPDDLPGRPPRARDAHGAHVGRWRRLSARAPGLPMGGRADAAARALAEPRRAAHDARVRARAEPLARGAPGRGAGGRERSRGARRGEGGPSRGLSRVGERRRMGSWTARLPGGHR